MQCNALQCTAPQHHRPTLLLQRKNAGIGAEMHRWMLATSNTLPIPPSLHLASSSLLSAANAITASLDSVKTYSYSGAKRDSGLKVSIVVDCFLFFFSSWVAARWVCRGDSGCWRAWCGWGTCRKGSRRSQILAYKGIVTVVMKSH